METGKFNEEADKNVYSSTVPNVYEIAVASAREAKRINERFYVAKMLPPSKLAITAIKNVIDGEVPYKVESQGSGNGNNVGKAVNGHS